MTLTKVYTCNICGEQIHNNAGSGVYFAAHQPGAFKLSSLTATEAIHICDPCLNRLGVLLDDRKKDPA